MRFNDNLMHNIKELGKNLSSVNLLLMKFNANWIIKCIIEGCPKLKTLTLESASDDFRNYLCIEKWTLEKLQKDCKELKDLKLSKVWFWNIHSEDEIKKILPDCNVELVEVGWRQQVGRGCRRQRRIYWIMFSENYGENNADEK